MNGKTTPSGDDKKRRPSKNTFTTKSGTAIKLNRSLGERIKAGREARARKKAAYLATLPKNPVKRFLYRLHPQRLARYWFSRDGAIMALKIAGVGLVVGFVLIVGTFAYFRKDLPNIKDLSAQKLGGTVTYYDRTGQTVLFQDYVDINRQPVVTTDMSKYIRLATIATEDKDFYKHGAFDMRGILRAVVNNLVGGSTQGGSTISMQFAKIDQENTANRTVGNKAKELILAIEMEREFSKDDILTGYLNAVPYGPISSGVEAAAQDYFGVHAKDLTITQAAFLAAIPQSPSVYSPYGPSYDPAKLVGRMQYIIGLMVEQGMITKEEGEAAKATDVLAQVRPERPSHWTGIKAASFVQAARDELEKKFTDKTIKLGGWKVITTVDMKLQDLAQKSVNDGMKQVRAQTPGGNCRDNRGNPCKDGATAAFVALDNATGQVVALVGNGDHDITDPNIGELNFGTNLFVSPGSTFKPYDYAAFIDNNNAGAGSVLYDSRGPIPGYSCTSDANCARDYDRVYPGPITLRYALGGSRNIPAMKAMLSSVPNDSSRDHIASINKTISTAEAMMGANDQDKKKYWCFLPGTDVYTASNIDKKAYREENQTQCNTSSAIGDGAYLKLDDHATGLSTLARLGQQIPHTYILKVTDSANKTIYEFKQPKPKQVLKPDTAYIVDDMASDPNASYMGGKFHNYNGWKFAIKTGTTNDSYDGLMASWSTKYTAVTWVGHYTRTVEMTGVMETMTRPIMSVWMKGAHTGLQPVNWEKPNGVKTLPAFVITNKVSKNSEVVPSTSTDLFPSWYNPPKEGGTSQTIDLISNKTATNCTPELARSSTQNGSHNTFSVDAFFGGANNITNTTGPTSDAVDDIHTCNDDAPPNVTLTTTSCNSILHCQLTVAVTKGQYPLSGGSYTTAPAGTLSITINGKTVETVAIPTSANNLWSYTRNYDLSSILPSDTKQLHISARAVDSVLYDRTDTDDVDL